MMKYVALWQESIRYPDYRIQTNDPEVARKLRRREITMIAGLGVNAPLWIFRFKYSSPKLAKQSLSRLCGTKYGELKEDASTGGFIAYTHTKLASKSGLESGKV